jgi:hypothetical protein
VLSGLAFSNPLTAPGAVAEDTDKTTVFHYSKVKDCVVLPRLEIGALLVQMLHYNSIIARRRQTPRLGERRNLRKWEA